MKSAAPDVCRRFGFQTLRNLRILRVCKVRKHFNRELFWEPYTRWCQSNRFLNPKRVSGACSLFGSNPCSTVEMPLLVFGLVYSVTVQPAAAVLSSALLCKHLIVFVQTLDIDWIFEAIGGGLDRLLWLLSVWWDRLFIHTYKWQTNLELLPGIDRANRLSYGSHEWIISL